MSTPEPQKGAVPPFAAATKCDESSCARDRIFEAAQNLFYRYGIRGVSVDQIAAEASTTKVTLYRVFSSKDDLIIQVLEAHKKRFWEWWDSIVAPFAGDPRRQLEALFDALADKVCAEDAGRGCPVANTAVEVVDDHPAKRIIHEHNAEIASRLQALAREMNATDPEELGNALTLLLVGAFAARIVFDNSRQVASVSRAAKALIESALPVR